MSRAAAEWPAGYAALLAPTLGLGADETRTAIETRIVDRGIARGCGFAAHRVATPGNAHPGNDHRTERQPQGQPLQWGRIGQVLLQINQR